MERLSLKVGGMTCTGCASAVDRLLALVPGVIESQVNFALAQATIGFDGQQTSAEAIVQAVTNAGYQATIVT